MPRNRDFDEWWEEQRQRDPDLARRTAEWLRTTGPKRKLPLLLDQCIEQDLVQRLRGSRALFRVTRLPDGADDSRLWHTARRKKMVIVTADGSDFWSDRKFPIHEGPGLIVLKGRTASDKEIALVRPVARANMIDTYRRDGPGIFDGLKMRCGTKSGTLRMFMFAESEVLTLTI